MWACGYGNGVNEMYSLVWSANNHNLTKVETNADVFLCTTPIGGISHPPATFGHYKHRNSYRQRYSQPPPFLDIIQIIASCMISVFVGSS